MGRVVFLLDVDNTLLDNDAVAADLRRHLTDLFGAPADRYWQLFEQLRGEVGYADYLGALQRFRMEHPGDPQLLEMSLFLVDYPFASRLYPHALETIAWLASRGTPVILSDGDAVFQPRKIARSGLWHSVHGRVLIYVHKEQMLVDVERRYPAERYVMIDDKIRLLSAIKAGWGDRVTTVFVKQGHYAQDAADVAKYPPADLTVAAIADVMTSTPAVL